MQFNSKHLRQVIITSIANIALVAPLVLGGINSNNVPANANSVMKMQHMHKRSKRTARNHKKSMRMHKSMNMKKGSMNKMMAMMMKSGMNMKGSKAPRGLKFARHAKYSKGSRIIVKASHMPGMKNAKGHVVGVFNTPLYEVTYQPTNHGKIVKNHKWLIGKEIKPSHKGRIRVGEKVTLHANHMKHMYNAKAKIVAIHHGPAYMINYTPKGTHMQVTNHKWLAQNELAK